jgi:hypothetical protein
MGEEGVLGRLDEDYHLWLALATTALAPPGGR